MDVNASIPTEITCYDCGEYVSSVVRDGWAVFEHTERGQLHPVRVWPWPSTRSDLQR